MRGRQPYLAVLGIDAAAADTPYVLVDLSDVTNYPHQETDHLLLHKLLLHGEKATDGEFDILVGVVTEVDGTNGSVEWIHSFHLVSQLNATDNSDRFAQVMDFRALDGEPLNLEVDDTVGSETLRYVVTNRSESGNTRWQTDVGLASPVGAAAGATGKPGPGDLVVLVDEGTDGGTLDFTLSAIYEAH